MYFHTFNNSSNFITKHGYFITSQEALIATSAHVTFLSENSAEFPRSGGSSSLPATCSRSEIVSSGFATKVKGFRRLSPKFCTVPVATSQLMFRRHELREFGEKRRVTDHAGVIGQLHWLQDVNHFCYCSTYFNFCT